MQMKSELVSKAASTLAEARANPCAETRQAATDASKALSAWVVANETPKGPAPGKGRGNLAGKRQYAEHRARYGL